jgi:bifunctional DNA-binding transcriptional regulator/antitoxin component of YhaV-PrlF toxin-antitoxin module
MKLQRAFAYTYGEKSHYKYQVTLPESVIQALGWEAGADLQATVNGDHLAITYLGKREVKTKVVEKRMPYEEFRDVIKKELKQNPSGLTWTEIRQNLKLPQTVPNNKWVRQMEKDISLLRVKEPRGTVWRLK